MPKQLDDLIASELVDYTLNDKTKRLVLDGLIDSQRYLKICDSRIVDLQENIADLRVKASQLISQLREAQDDKAQEIAAVVEIRDLLGPRKV